MNNRERMRAILHYKDVDRLPIVHFGFWNETLEKWASEGHITGDEAKSWGDGNDADKSISKKLGFDCNYNCVTVTNMGLLPSFEEIVIEEMPDGFRKVRNGEGVIVLQRDEAGSIPAEVDHLLKERKDWEEHYLPRLQYTDERANLSPEQIAYINDENRSDWHGIFCGSLFGSLRNLIGVEGSAYIHADDPDLFKEMIDVIGNLAYTCIHKILEQTDKFDYAHFWEDICFKSGPLIVPSVFDELCGPHYKRITDLLLNHGIDTVSLDCDGMIDRLIPTWINNGVNTMFPIEVGTWGASIAPWREKYGKDIRGVGGMNKVVFARDYATIDAEIERMKPLVALGGYVPCPDHRIPPDAKWENVQYYCDKMRKTFG